MRRPEEFTVAAQEDYDALVRWLSGASVHGLMIDGGTRYRVYTGPGFLACVVHARGEGVSLMDGLMDDKRLPVPTYNGRPRQTRIPLAIHDPVFNYHDACGAR
jgi:hypothetical protein